MGLPRIQHVKLDLLGHFGKRHASRIQPRLTLLCQLLDALPDIAHVQVGQCAVQGLHRIVAHVGHHATQRRRDTRVARHDAGGHADLAHHGADMQGAAATEGHVGKLARVMATFNRHHPNRAGHAGVGHRQDRLGCCHHIQA